MCALVYTAGIRRDTHREREDAMMGIAPSLRKKGILALACTIVLGAALFIALPAPASADTGNRTLPKSKTATWVDEGKTARVTLQLPNFGPNSSSDVLFVVDNSSCADAAINDARATLDRLVAEAAGGNQMKVGVVSFRGDGHVEKELSELSAGNVDELKDAISGGYTGGLNSGTNMHDGLLKAKAILDADTDVPANRKYVVLVSDGLTRLFTGQDGTVKDIYYQYSYNDPTSVKPASELDVKSFVYFGMIDEWRQARTPDASTYTMPYGDWDTYYAHLVEWIGNDGDTYAQSFTKYGNDATSKVKDPATGAIIDPDFTFIEHGTQADHAMAPDRAIFEAYTTWQALKGEGYACYAARTGSGSDLSVKFMNQLNEGASLDFTQIADSILYACGSGSKVVDSMGKGDSYDFDFVPGTATLSVGDSQLEATDEGGNVWTFHTPGTTVPRFTLAYNADRDAYELTAHERVSNYAPVKLTYDVKLTKAPTEAGDYELATNTEAMLLPVSSAGVPGTAESFDVPKLAYTAKASNDPGKPDAKSGETLPQAGDPISFLPLIAAALAAAAVIGTAAGARALKKR